MAETETQISFSKSLAFIIGIEEYEHVYRCRPR